MDAETLLELLGADADVRRDAGGCWLHRSDLDVRGMAELMLAHEVRLVSITARSDPAGGFRVLYHWDAGAGVVTVSTTVAPDGVPTIADLIPGADWAEREIRDYYDVRFGGRPSTPALMLREGDPPGLFSRTAELGRDVDPASTARAAAASGRGDHQ